MKSLQNNEQGLAHLAAILVVALVVSAGVFTYWRVSDSKTSQNSEDSLSETETVETLPQDLANIKTLDEVEQLAGATNGVSIINFVLESKDGGYVYKVILSNGKKLVLNATTGAVISEETTDVSDNDKIPSGVQVTVSPAQAYQIAAAKSSSPIKKIEMEVEDKKVVYKVEFKDGSKVEINASTATIVKSEIKNEDNDKVKDEDKDQVEDRRDEQEDEVENHDNEDSDDSEDSEDHAEEDR